MTNFHLCPKRSTSPNVAASGPASSSCCKAGQVGSLLSTRNRDSDNDHGKQPNTIPHPALYLPVSTLKLCAVQLDAFSHFCVSSLKRRGKEKMHFFFCRIFFLDGLFGAPIASKSHTYPSHSQTSRLLTSSLSSGFPVPRPTQCVRGA